MLPAKKAFHPIVVMYLFKECNNVTGTRDLLEIPLSWQETYIYQCDFANETCPTPNPQVAK